MKQSLCMKNIVPSNWVLMQFKVKLDEFYIQVRIKFLFCLTSLVNEKFTTDWNIFGFDSNIFKPANLFKIIDFIKYSDKLEVF